MGKLIVVLAFLAGATSALAQGPLNPTWTRGSQGQAITALAVSCSTADDQALLSAAQTADARAITFCNSSATTVVALICPLATCAHSALIGVTLEPVIDGGGCLTFRDAVDSTTWTCDGLGGTAIVGIVIEK
jgi:hypothetical protein